MRVIALFSTCAALSATLHAADLPAPKARHVILCVWDGMRPDFITPELTPHLHAFAQRGTFFTHHHAFWVATTEVNGTVLATGAFPKRSGIVGNREYRPALNLMEAVDTQGAAEIRIGDALTDGKYLGALTVAEIVQARGQRTVVAGTKPVALLHDRTPGPGSVALFAGKTYPAAALKTLTTALGPWPDYPPAPETLDESQPNTAQNRWTTRAFTEVLWGRELPRYAVLWLGDPDYSQHLTAPGHPCALAAIRDCDAHFGLLLAALEKRRALAETDLFVVSDHGFSTIERTAKITDTLRRAGVAAASYFPLTPKDDDVLCVNVGGATGCYVVGHSPAVVQKIVDALHASEFAGPVFTRTGLPGTFPLADVQLDSAECPDVVFSYRWREEKNPYGVPGLMFGEARRPGGGTHGTLSRYCIRNTLVAAGPDIVAGQRSALPSGNIDVVPTLLHLLGLPHPDGTDGRVLAEALVGAPAAVEKPVTQRREATRVLPGGKTWRQHLQTTTYAGKTYFDEGNAAAE